MELSVLVLSRKFADKKKRCRPLLVVGSTAELKGDVEEAKLENGESIDKLKEWGQENEGRIDIVDNEIKVLETRVKTAIAETENTEREKQENLLAREREEQLKFERKQLE